jgi:unsaturated rhamnogalacturonyl hydrolase
MSRNILHRIGNCTCRKAARSNRAALPVFRFPGIIVFLLMVTAAGCRGQEQLVSTSLPWSQRIARTYLLRHPGAVTYDTGFTSTKWTYEQGLMLTAFERMSGWSGDTAYAGFVRRNLEQYVNPDGSIRTYKQDDLNLDNCAPGRSLLTVYKWTGEERYRKAAELLREQLLKMPRTSEGGFWHKKIYPSQMWLDGLYMAEPFYARYAVMTGDTAALSDVFRQFRLIANHTFDPATGLYYHGWDESRKERWANPATGCSPSFWGRSIGWYAMALVDVLDEISEKDPRRQELVSALKNLGKSLLMYRDPGSYVWFQVVDQGMKPGNYLESSASCMFAYVFAKGASRGWLDSSYARYARESFEGILKTFVTVEQDGTITLRETCRGAGLGGTPYRDGSFSYYANELRRTNDPKGIGPFMLAAMEIEKNSAQQGGGAVK